MLVLSRARDESVILTDTVSGHQTTVTVVAINGGHVRLGFSAPQAVVVNRRELQERIDAEDRRRDSGDRP